jgi:hypothetical protein
MTETIRNHFRRRMRWAMTLSLSGFLILAAWLAWIGPQKAVASTKLIPCAIGLSLFGIGLYLSGSTRCPQCSNSIREMTATFAAFKFLIRDPPGYCPYCGISLDDPWS